MLWSWPSHGSCRGTSSPTWGRRTGGRLSWATPCLCKRSMGARPQTTRSTPSTSPGCSVGACSRRPLTRQRAARRAHLPPTTSPYPLAALGTPLASKAQRDGVAARCPAPAVPPRGEGDLALLDHEERRRRAVAAPLVQTATPHQAPTRSRRPAVPGIGPMVRVVWLAARQALARCPRRQAVVSSGRRVPCAQASAGHRAGTAGATIGPASRPGAGAAAAVLLLRPTPAGQTSLTRLAHTPGQGQARTLVAPPGARAVSSRRKRAPACAMPQGLTGCGRGAEAPTASRADPGRRLAWRALIIAGVKDRGGAQRPLRPEPFALDATAAPAPLAAARVPCGCRGLPLLRPCASRAQAWHAAPPWPRTGRGHGDVARPQRTTPRLSARAMTMVTEPPEVCGADTRCLGRPRELTAAPVARGGRRQAQHGGKKLAHPL